jgi:hypothetical protein
MERKHVKYQRLIDFCKTLPPTPTAVAHPCDESSLRGAVDAAKLGLIAPILVGPRARIEAVAIVPPYAGSSSIKSGDTRARRPSHTRAGSTGRSA